MLKIRRNLTQDMKVLGFALALILAALASASAVRADAKGNPGISPSSKVMVSQTVTGEAGQAVPMNVDTCSRTYQIVDQWGEYGSTCQEAYNNDISSLTDQASADCISRGGYGNLCSSSYIQGGCFPVGGQYIAYGTLRYSCAMPPL